MKPIVPAKLTDSHVPSTLQGTVYVACAKVPTLVVTFMVMVSPEPSCSVERVPLPFSTNLTTAALPFAMFDKLLDVPVVAQDTLVLSEATMLLVWIVLFEIGAWMYPVNFGLQMFVKV